MALMVLQVSDQQKDFPLYTDLLSQIFACMSNKWEVCVQSPKMQLAYKSNK